MEYYILLLALVVIAFIFSLPSVKGYFGELSIRIWLSFLDKRKYKIINDVMIPSGEDKTAQIDHIVISVYGIFVIETKNYKGWIYGNETSKNWTQVIYKTKNQFYNPILQNKGHVKALKILLSEYPNIKYIPIVVFTSKADFKKLNVSSHVIYSLWLNRTIKKYTEEYIDSGDIESISNLIINANNKDKSARMEHVSRIQVNKENYARAAGSECPWCGELLVERQGKYGKFTGCENYPKCKFVSKR
ncbi:MAG: NERD domain-containing protein [Clostridiales bacterium]|nr:NERD domain-containing protein [Clostridiales bacterium]